MYFTVNLTIEVTVTPSIIHALDDYAETVQDQPVSIPVLNNDWGNGDTIKVEDVPLVNHGSIALNPDSTLVTFTPSAGFVGLAHFNYTICDEDGTCDMATVTISVMSIEPPVFDTLRLTTPKDTPREILLPLDGYSLDSAPTNGWLDSTSNSYIVYHPNPGFFDDYDYFTYSKSGPAGTQQIDVIMHVLDIDAGNLFVKDDYASTPIGQSVEIDALSNDLGGEHLQSVAIVLQPRTVAPSIWEAVFSSTRPTRVFPDWISSCTGPSRPTAPSWSTVRYTSPSAIRCLHRVRSR